MADKNVGFIGLGIMGRPMAKNLLKAGYAVTVFDVVGSAVEELVTEGAQSVSSSREVAEATPVIITMVPDSADSEAAIMGPGGVLEGASAGDTIVDMSSIAPGSSQKIAAACEAQRVNFLDAPVSGGEPKAIDGTLAIMVGGKQDIFDSQSEMLDILGGSIVLCGDYGAGNTTKLANQIIVAANIEAVAEALVLAKKAGLDPNTVYQAIRGGLAGSTVMDAKAPMMIEGNFAPGFRIRLHQKDLHNAILTGKELGVPLPITSAIQQMLGSLMNAGKADADHAAIAHFIEDMAGVTISGRQVGDPVVQGRGRHALTEIIDRWVAPGPQPNGLQATPTGLWLIDQRDNHLYKLDYADGSVMERLPTDTDRPSGVTEGGGNMWVAQTYSFRLHKLDANGATLAHYDTPGKGVVGFGDRDASDVTGAHGMEWGDDNNMWIAVPPARKLYLIDPSTMEVRRSIPTLRNRPHGIFLDGDGLWCADTQMAKVHGLDPETGEVRQEVDVPGPEVHGMTLHDRAIWFCCAETHRVCTIALHA